MGAFLFGVLWLGSPVLVYAGLAALRPGRAATQGIGVAAALTLTLWACWPLGAGPLFTGVPRADAEAVALLSFWTIGVVAAGIAQAIRPRLPARRGAYPALALLLPLGLLALLLPRLAF